MAASRGSYYLLRLLGRNASHFPGVLAQRVFPDVLKYLERPNKVVAITGTNGKTTTTNMIVDFLESNNTDLVSNTYGSNIEGGIISSLLRATSFFGKNKKDLAVFEVDERSSVHIFPYIKPDILVVTNLYRDSNKRNAHVGYIVKVLESGLPKSTHLVLNGDDVFAASLSLDNPRSYFSISPQKFEEQILDSIIQDAPYCLNCGGVLSYDFKRYHHIGFVHCNTCGYKSAHADYNLKTISETEIEIIENDEVYIYKNTIRNITDNYNKLAAISALRQLGYTHSEIKESFEKNMLGVTESRYDESIVNNKRIISIVAKRQNPIANSRVFDFVRKQKDWGTMTVMIMNEEETHDINFKEVESTSWHYDADFEYLNSPNIKKIYLMGNRNLEYKTRLVLAGVCEDDIEMLKPADSIDVEFNSETFVLLHDILNVAQAKNFRKYLESEAAK